MAKRSQIEKALASLKAERDVLDLAIRKLEAQIVAKHFGLSIKSTRVDSISSPEQREDIGR